PFLRHEFLHAAERSGSVGGDTGWLPRHLTLTDGGSLRAALPLYEKRHSWGEFVFDWSWAQAYGQAGLDYYPKLVAAVPFTPAAGPRLLLADAADGEAAAALLAGAIDLARREAYSSFHVLFPAAADLPHLAAAGMKLRKDCQFHWHNRDYETFDDFLATFSSRKRKKVRQDRRRASAAGITFRRLRGAELNREEWYEIYRLISRTFMRRGSLPYFEFDFFLEVSTALSASVLVVRAELGADVVAAAVFFENDDTLYGRYWGSVGHYDALHFETCYYQGIEHCIETGRQRFEPGTQGEHKVSRGFVPTETWSAHWLAHPEFFSAISEYLDEEQRHVERYMEAIDARTPYRAGDDGRPT
ncbi:MAG: peptidogalycan biosysnthesis protein, partial [Woeseiaceae bacterium]|nr:peptidogalycan biosysnthesis protein [Woeseiaceae bacterium]